MRGIYFAILWCLNCTNPFDAEKIRRGGTKMKEMPMIETGIGLGCDNVH